MKTIEIPTDDPLKMIWAIREKQYEETKNRTEEERDEYSRKKVEAFQKLESREDHITFIEGLRLND